jgi:hypothetical protein
LALLGESKQNAEKFVTVVALPDTFRSGERMGTIDEQIITGFGRQEGSMIWSHCHGIDRNRNTITVLNITELHKKVNLSFDRRWQL